MKKNKTPPDNTGKKYLTELTHKQRKFIDVYCSKYGEISATACAIAAGYSRDSAHTKASELLNYRKYPQVRTEILGGLYIEKLHTLNENRELSEDELNEKIRKIFPTKTDFLKGSKNMLEGVYEEGAEPDKD